MWHVNGIGELKYKRNIILHLTREKTKKQSVQESCYVATLNSVKRYFKRPVETLTKFSKPNIYYGFNADDRKKSENQPVKLYNQSGFDSEEVAAR
jgi:hypothetical protein